jgi:transcriptional regulator NrdR family protein
MSPSEAMCHPFRNDAPHISCEVHRSRIVQRILDSLRMVTSVCYLLTFAIVYLSFVVSAA